MAEAKMLSGQRVLVTGARGFLGQHLCRRLKESGADVFGVSRSEVSEQLFCDRWFCADVADLDSIKEVFKTAQPEVVFHLSGHGVGSPDLENVLPTLRNDLVTTVNVLTVVTQERARRFVMAASLEEPQPGASDPIPSSPYAAAKWASSSYARMFHRLYGTPVVITRPMMAYGPGQKSHKLIPYVASSLLQGKAPKLSSGNRTADWIYVDDVIDGMLAAATMPNLEGSSIDLGSGVLVSIRDVVLQIAEIIGNRVVPEFGALTERPMEKVRIADTAEAFTKLAWKQRISLRAGLEQTVEWYRKQLALSDRNLTSVGATE